VWSAPIVLACALSLLGRSEHTFHPINLVVVPPPHASRNVGAYVTHDPPTIHLVTSAAVFAEAARAARRCGNRDAIAKIASIVMHEEWHLRHGPDERAAYSHQLTTLASLGFDESSRVYFSVKRAMLRVVQGSSASVRVAAVPRERAGYFATDRNNPHPGSSRLP
jgi:hypothetical protein